MLRWIYIISIVLSLWTVYLLAFKTYTKKRHQKDWEQVVYPMIICFFYLLLAFVPGVNLIMASIIIVNPLFEPDEWMIDSWLFKKPGQKE